MFTFNNKAIHVQMDIPKSKALFVADALVELKYNVTEVIHHYPVGSTTIVVHGCCEISTLAHTIQNILK